MNGFKLISSKQLIAELFSDFNISNTDWVAKAQRHIARGLGIMKIDGYYERAYALETVYDYKAPLPCDEKYIIAVVLPDNRFARLPLSRSLSLGANFKDITLHSHLKGNINFNHLHTNFETGRVMYVYYRIPVDNNGDLLIPDNDDVLEALPYFVLYKLSLSGYKHPSIDMEMADARWRELYPRARNSMNYPSLEEKHHSTFVNTNPIFTHIIEEDWTTNIIDNSLSVADFLEELKSTNPAIGNIDQWEETV